MVVELLDTCADNCTHRRPSAVQTFVCPSPTPSGWPKTQPKHKPLRREPRGPGAPEDRPCLDKTFHAPRMLHPQVLPEPPIAAKKGKPQTGPERPTFRSPSPMLLHPGRPRIPSTLPIVPASLPVQPVPYTHTHWRRRRCCHKNKRATAVPSVQSPPGSSRVRSGYVKRQDQESGLIENAVCHNHPQKPRSRRPFGNVATRKEKSVPHN